MMQLAGKVALILALVACVASAAPFDDAPAAPSMNSFFGALSDLGNKAKEAVSSVTPADAPKVPDASSINQEIKKQTEGFGSFGSFFNKVSDAVKSAQESAQKSLADQQKSPAAESLQSGAQKAQEAVKSFAESTQQGAAQQAQQGQTAFAAALSEIGKNLQSFAQTNPSLMPDVKKIYEKVSSKFSSGAGSTVAPPGAAL